MANKNIVVLGIDCQNDFMEGGNLAVSGALEDMRRFSECVRQNMYVISDIIMTLDSHHLNDIGHASFWINSKGEHPDPFTVISVADIEAGTWFSRFGSLRAWSLDYAKALATQGKYPILIWPDHCLIGSPGAAIEAKVFGAINQWAKVRGGVVSFITKGSNIKSEHYSAVKTEVPVAEDQGTQLNTHLVHELLGKADEIWVGGEAASHCVLSTMNDIWDNLPAEYAKKFVLLKDCMSPVGEFEQAAQDFYSSAAARGVRVCNSTEL